MKELEEGGRINVSIKPVYIFLFKDGRCSRDRARHYHLMSSSIARDCRLDPPRQ